MNQILQDPYLYELLKDIQKQCSSSSLEALARETGFLKRKRQMTPEAFLAFVFYSRSLAVNHRWDECVAIFI